MYSFLVFLLFFAACQRAPKDPCTHFEGSARESPYHIAIGKQLDRKEKKEAERIIQKTFQEIEVLFSEISQFNEAPAHTPFSLSKHLRDLLIFSEKIVSLSSGRFDPAVNPLICLWKKALKQKKSPSPKELQGACDASGWNHLHLQGDSLFKDHPETSLDLSAISKGLCVDWIVERLQAKGYSHLLVKWGGEMRASGSHPEGHPWIIPIHPKLTSQGGNPLAPIPLRNGAIATSGDAGQKGWILPAEAASDRQIHRYFPIIDPATAQPLEKTPYSIAMVTVIAPTCALADALATAAMIFPGRKEAESWAQEVVALHPEVSFWILSYDPKR